MFHQLEALLLSYAQTVPLLIFAPVASFAEEIIAPIPSGPVMLVIGSVAAVQGYSLPFLIVIAIAAALGKVAGGLVVYLIADKLEDVFADKFARFLGVTHTQIEQFGARFGKGWKDYALLTLLRTLPFVPSALISFGAGALKLKLRLFIVATFIGSIFRDAFYLYFGFVGLGAAEAIMNRFSTLETILLIALAVIVPAALLYLYLRRRGEKAVR
ncbi:MAG TPA: VTT domain-containing protein [Candidatus Paceibacterota bacterium]|nr:VTT domain-containing protein [Candidatus Paceibacterota bacterium]